MNYHSDPEGYYGRFGGAYVPEILHKCVEDMHLRIPRMVGFGISNRATFEAACAHASGGIIGSRFVTLLEEEKGDAGRAISRLKADIGL